jgi:hypothetical protein
MKTLFNKSILALAITAGLLASCVNEDDYETPQLNCAETYLTSNLTPQQVPAVDMAKPYKGNGPAGGIIEAYVVSSDVSGNFFKSISLQTKDGSFGFSIPVDVESVFRKMEPGRLVYVKLDSTYTDIEFGSLRIGALYNETQVGRLAPADFKEIVIPSCTVMNEEELVQKISIQEALKDARLNTLIELQNVEFVKESVYDTYYDPSNEIGGATNHYLEDATGRRVIFRTSEFAAYAAHTVPKESGSVRGIMTKYNDDYQFIVRTENDIKLTQPRFGEAPPEPGQSQSAQVGSAIAFSGILAENFESYALNASSFPKYVADYTLGNRYWQVKQFPAGTGNKYIEMTSFNGANNPGAPAKTYLFVPVDFTSANTFTFSKEIRYMTGEALKIYYVKSADYQAGFAIDPSKLVNITGSFTNLIYPENGQSQNTFTTAGTYSIPESLTGNGYFVFEYMGSTTITTTIQIDDIAIN